MGREQFGELEEQLLLVLLRLGTASAGQIVEELSDRTGRDVSPATAFMILRRLEDRRLLTSTVDRQSDTGARPRRLFVARRALVVPLLRSARRARLALWDGLDEVVE